MKMIGSIAAAGVIAISGAAYVYAAGAVNPAARACEEALQERLVSPTSYRLASVSETTREITKEEFLAPWKKTGNLKTVKLMSGYFDKMQQKPKVVEVSMDYDAANSYGTVIRGHSDCDYRQDISFAAIR